MDSVFGVESAAYVALRALLSACSVVLLGAVAFRVGVLPRYAGPDREALRDALETRLPMLLRAVGAVAVVATLARLAAQHAAVFGSDVAPSSATLSALLLRSQWGRIWWIAIACALAVTGLAWRRRSREAAAWMGFAALTLTFAATQPWSGHPAAAERPLLAIATQLLHVVGAGGWVGCLAVLTVVAIPAAAALPAPSAADTRIAGLVRAFSPTALGFAALLAATGLLTAWRSLGGTLFAWDSPYARVLLFKLAVLLVVAGVGAHNWRRVLPSLGTASATAALRRSALLELATAAVVLAATAVLVATPMPGE